MAEGRSEGAQRGLRGGALWRHRIGFTPVTGCNGHLYRRRTNLLQVTNNQLVDAVGGLIGHEPECEFRAGPGRDDGFAALALVTAGEAVDLAGGSGGTLLLRRKAFFPEESSYAQ